MKHLIPALALTAVSGAAMAHSGVTNPAVMARMEAMSTIAAEVKALSGMARGEVAFDADVVANRMEAIAATGAEVPVLFEAPEADPNSEAAPTIWTSYPEFAMRAMAMVKVAEAGTGAEDAFALREALADLGETCKSCHASYRIPQ